MNETVILYAAAAIVLLVVGWIGGRWYAKHAPTEREVVFKAAAALTKRLSALQSTAPEAMAQAAAQAASEAVTLQQFKDAVAELK